MKTEFKSQICTTREQSERLLALGLKKETANMCWTKVGTKSRTFYVPELAPINMVSWRHTPAWSLDRLIEMMPNEIRKYDAYAILSVNNELVQYGYYDIDYNYGTCLEHFNDGTLFDNIIDCIEWLIKDGYFNKEFLV